MARYGISRFGRSFYGEPAIAAYSADPFVGTEQGYGGVRLTWTTPGANWSEIRLIRSAIGYPVDVTNGVQVYSAVSGADLGEFSEGGLPVDRWVYYSLFVFDPNYGEWIKSGDCKVYVAANLGGPERLYNLLPNIYRGQDFNVTDEGRRNAPLAAYMSVLGFQYDVLRNQMNSLLDLYSPSRVSYDLVPVLMHELGIPAETELAPEQYRRFLSEAVHFYKTKGTLPCVLGVTSAVTGYDASVSIGANLLWDTDHSDFIGSIGYWGAQALRCNVIWVRNGLDLNSSPPAMRLQATSNGLAGTTFVTDDTVDDLGIPVVHNKTYTVESEVSASDGAQSPAYLRIDWYDVGGNFISSDQGLGVPLRQGVRSTVSLTATAPDNAVYLAPWQMVDNARTNTFYDVFKVRIVAGTDAGEHQPGRDIRIALQAQRINEIINGSFERDVVGWEPNGAADREQYSVRAADEGGYSMRVWRSGALTGEDFVVHQFTTKPGFRYVVQYRVAQGEHPPASEWAARIGVSTLPSTENVFAFATVAVDGLDETFVAGPSIPFIAQGTSTFLLLETGDAPADGDDFLIDWVLAEVQADGSDIDVTNNVSGVVRPYFDGGQISLTGDVFWEGEEYASRSHFYFRRSVGESRLAEILPRYLPFGATYTLLYAQPATTLYVSDDVVLVREDPAPPTAPVGRDVGLRWKQNFSNASVLALRYNVKAYATEDREVIWDTEMDPTPDISDTFFDQ